MKLLPAKNPESDLGSENYAVVVATDEVGVFEIVESQPTEAKALHAMRVLQTHSDSNGGEARYEVVLKP